MLKKAAALGLALSLVAVPMFADEGNVPRGIPHLDHVFVIMMENHGYSQVVGNPNEPYLNALINGRQVNLATNYFAVGHPSLTNYLEIVGGSNFGIRSDNPPNWHSSSCTTNLATGIVNADDGGSSLVPPVPAPVPFESSNVCPISGSGTDAETPAVDNWNEVAGPNFLFLADIDGAKSVPAASTAGKTIGDQLVTKGLSWKSYQESLPVAGADLVTYSNGTASNLTDFTNLSPLITSSSVVQAYAVKHNPFAYFKSVQEGTGVNSLASIVGFDGPNGFYADLARGTVPSLAFIAPNQCNDQHGRGNGDAFCAFDPGVNPDGTVGTLDGLNGGLILQGDTTIERLVQAITASPVWHDGRNAIVVVWDENDYSGTAAAQTGVFPSQFQNRVVLTVQTNGGRTGAQSDRFYDSFSLLKSMEAGFGLPCLNHACDSSVHVMSDLFGAGGDE